MASTFELNLPAGAWVPDPTNGPAFSVAQQRPYWAFDGATAEIIYSRMFQIPQAYNGGTVSLDVWYYMDTDASGTIELEVSVEAVTDGDALDLSAADSFDAINNGSETVPATAGHGSKLTVTLTNKDSLAIGDYCRLKIRRDAADGTNDTATGDLHFLGAIMREAV